MVNLLTPAEAAQLLGCKPKTLANWRATRSQDLTFVKVGTKVMYELAEIEAFIVRHRQAAT